MREISSVSRLVVNWRLSSAFAIFVMAGLSTNADAQSVSFQGLGYLSGGTTSIATGVSADGTVVVGYGDATGSTQEAFRWTSGGGISGLGFIAGGNTSQALGISADGSVVVGHANSSGTPNYAFKWTSGGGMTSVASSDCAGQGPFAYGTNSNGALIVGNVDGTVAPDCFPGRAVEWVSGGSYQLLFPNPPATPPSGLARGVSSDGLVIVGQVAANTGPSCNPCTQAFRWTGGSGVTLGDLGGNFSAAYAANSDGSVVVGTAAVDIVNSQPFRWTAAGGLVGLGGQSINATAYAVSSDGSVVAGEASGKAFRWTAATGLLYVQDLLVASGVNLSGWNLKQATGISADGTTIVGTADSPSGGQAWIARLPATAVTRTSTHDFNGNGYSDIAWRQTGGTTAAWLMNGAQVVQSGGFGVVPTSWQIVGQRDFDGDGKYDWLWRDSTTNTVAVWLLNGLQVSSSGSLGTVPSNWTIYGTSDFNGDGKADILWRDSASNTVAIWLMNGLQVAQSGSVGSVPSNWVIVGTDGKGHILWRDNSSGTVAVWVMNGLQVSQTASLGAVPGNWAILGAGDFNGVGKTCSDIVWRDSTTNTVAIWLVNNGQVTGSGTLGVVPSNWSIVLTGDFNGDGKTDILWRDSTSGTVAIWFMNGLQVASTASVAVVAADWSIQGANAD
jgi:probable HAF family extracellular repeat protein